MLRLASVIAQNVPPERSGHHIFRVTHEMSLRDIEVFESTRCQVANTWILTSEINVDFFEEFFCVPKEHIVGKRNKKWNNVPEERLVLYSIFLQDISTKMGNRQDLFFVAYHTPSAGTKLQQGDSCY